MMTNLKKRAMQQSQDNPFKGLPQTQDKTLLSVGGSTAAQIGPNKGPKFMSTTQISLSLATEM